MEVTTAGEALVSEELLTFHFIWTTKSNMTWFPVFDGCISMRIKYTLSIPYQNQYISIFWALLGLKHILDAKFVLEMVNVISFWTN